MSEPSHRDPRSEPLPDAGSSLQAATAAQRTRAFWFSLAPAVLTIVVGLAFALARSDSHQRGWDLFFSGLIVLSIGLVTLVAGGIFTIFPRTRAVGLGMVIASGFALLLSLMTCAGSGM